MISVSPGRVARSDRGPVSIGRPQVSQPMAFPAPVSGLVTSADIASQTSGAASVLRNFLPTASGARIRGGCARHALLAGGGAVRRMFGYSFGLVSRLFAATDAGIFDVTSPEAPPAVTAPAVSGLNSGDWSTFQHTNAGVSYLVCCNGMDSRRLFDGTSWTTAPAITFGDSTTMAQLAHGFLFANREWFLKANSFDAYYLGVSALGGAASVFPLGGVLRKGGSLLTGFSWSLETGTGANEYCVFVSTEGEVAIYSGSDPANASTFALQGVYQIGLPLGKTAWFRLGGDVLIATIDGLIPMSQVFQRDQASVVSVAKSRPIENEWRRAAREAGGGYTVTVWPDCNLAFIAVPRVANVDDVTFVMSTQTGRWSTISGWRATCYAVLRRALFFGNGEGLVFRGDFTGADDGLAFNATYLSAFQAASLGQRADASMASMRVWSAMRPSLRLFARADFDTTEAPAPDVTVNTSSVSTWDAGLWDVARWDAGAESRQLHAFRDNVRAAGDFLALGCVVSSFGPTALDLELDLGLLQVLPGEARA